MPTLHYLMNEIQAITQCQYIVRAKVTIKFEEFYK